MVKGKMVSMVFLDPYSIKKELGDESDYDIMFCIDCLKLAIQDYKEKLGKELKQSEMQKLESETPLTEEQNEINNETKDVELQMGSTIDPLEDDDFGGADFIEGLFDDEFFEED